MSRWYRPDGTLSLTREPGAVPSVTTVLARVWPRPALQAWRERQLLELAAACPPGPGQDPSDWVRSIRQSADQYARAAAEEGSRIHADLAEGRIPPGVQTALLLHEIDLRLGRTEVTMVGDRYGGTIDALGAHWILDWKTTGDSELRVWPDWLVQLAAYDALVGGRSVWAIVVLHRDSPRYRVYAVEPPEMAWARRAWSACLALWEVLEEAPV